MITATATGQPPLSRSERVKLAIHRWLDKHLSAIGVWIMRLSKGRITEAYKVNALLLTTRGRRSGRERTVVLQYFPEGATMVVVAANDGGARHPGWYFNLSTSPDASVEVAGRHMQVHATQLSGAEASAWWRRIVQAAPDYERYRRATRRPFPIVRLVPTGVIAEREIA